MQDNLTSCTNSTPWSTFCSGLTQSMFFCSAVSAAQRALSHLVDHSMFLFPSIVCWGPSRVTLRHDGTISMTSEASLREKDGFISTVPYIHVENMTAEVFYFCYSMCLWYDIWYVHTNIDTCVHTDTTCIKQIKELAQAHPITANVLYQLVQGLISPVGATFVVSRNTSSFTPLTLTEQLENTEMQEQKQEWEGTPRTEVETLDWGPMRVWLR